MIKISLLAFITLFALSFGSIAQSPSPSPSVSPSPPPEQNTRRPARLRVSQGVAAGLVRHKVAPVYPEEAKVRHITGDVVVTFLIDTQGNVEEIWAARGDPILVKAAVEAVRQWKHKPYTLNGQPVEVETLTTIHFKM